MLNRLYVKNYAIIDETEVSFKEKLNILTGETGAGKSILIGSVNAALGAKTSKDIIRHGADYALIELSFSALSKKVEEELKELDIYPEDGEILLSRKITSAGKSICRINGETVSAEDLRACASTLIDIHGQNEHHSLLKASSHVKIVDKMAGEGLFVVLQKMKSEYELWKKIRNELEEAESQDKGRDNDVGYLEYALSEIRGINPQIGEDETLEEEFKVLSNSKQIMESLNQGLRLVSESDSGNAGEMVNEAIRFVSKAAQYDDKLSGLLDILENASDLLSDFAHDAESYMSRAENFAERFEIVDKRLDLINTLKKKYGSVNGGIEEVLEYAEKAEKTLDRLSNFDEYVEKLRKDEKISREKCLLLCKEITSLRTTAANALAKRITEELKDLNFVGATFSCNLGESDSFTANGKDSCEFFISLNPGEPMKPLVKVASGGELSRVMLAIKTVLADKDEIDSLIFDEIDTGISGRTAQKVAEKLAVLADSHQIICITHLAQLASMADTHFLIEKTNGENYVRTGLKELFDKDRTEEVARIVGGAEITDKVMENAAEMIGLASNFKHSIRRE